MCLMIRILAHANAGHRAAHDVSRENQLGKTPIFRIACKCADIQRCMKLKKGGYFR
jgi:hypothetical protein